jgi:hypothetical protein
MMRKAFSALFAVLVPFCLISGCAGGTGAGNPTSGLNVPAGQAVLSVQAVSSLAGPLQKALAGSTLVITDHGGTLFNVESALLNVSQIRLGLPDGMACSDLGFKLEAPALCGQGTIVLDGPFVFDLFTGTAVPPLDTLKLPVGLYNTLELVLEAGITVNVPIDTVSVAQAFTLEMKGFFPYDTKPDLRFTMLLGFSHAFPLILAQSMEVDSTAPAAFHVQLNVIDLMQGTNIASCLNSQGLALDSTGNLLIEKNQMRGSCTALETNLMQNFRNMEIAVNGIAAQKSGQ